MPSPLDSPGGAVALGGASPCFPSSCPLLLVCLLAIGLASPDRAEGGGLQVGDLFRIHSQFSITWNDRGLPWEEMDLRGKLSESPFSLDITLEGRVVGDGRIALEPRITSLRYNRGRAEGRWRHQEKDRNRRTEDLLSQRSSNLALSWRHQFSSHLEREALEEQLVGTAIALLHKSKIEMHFKTGRAEFEFPGLDRLLDEKLPDPFPESLRHRIPAFFREACTRALVLEFVPRRPGGEFTREGRAYRVGQLKEAKGQCRAVVQSLTERDGSTIMFRETLVFDCISGLVLEGEYLRVPDALEGNATRVGAVRWKTKLLAFRKGKTG